MALAKLLWTVRLTGAGSLKRERDAVRVAAWVILLLPATCLSQAMWARADKTDALRGTAYSRFTLEGKFLEAPRQGHASSPTFVVDCDSTKHRVRGHQIGQLLDAYISVGTVIDSILGGGGEHLFGEYRVDDGKVKTAVWSYSSNYAAIVLSSPTGEEGNFEMYLDDLLYSHKAVYKENTSVQAKKAVIRVSEFLGGNITMEFDLPDPAVVADSCGLFLIKQ